MATQRLPIPGQDDGTWGDILNGFLEASHNADGTLNTTAVSNALPSPIPSAKLGSGTASSSNFLRGDGTWAVPVSSGGTVTSVAATDATITVTGTATAPTLAVGTIPESKVTNLTSDLAAKAPLASPTFTGTVTVPTPVNGTDAATKSYVDSTTASGIAPDATTTSKGIVELAGDLGGTAASPSVLKVKGVTLPASAPTTGQVLTATSTTAASWSTPAAGAGNATTSSVGVVQLAGDLSGTATAPTVAKVNGTSIPATPTTGQVLTATSGTTATWQTPASGFADPTTAKGDLIIHGASTTTRQAIGSDGQVLTADSTQATGAKWSTLSTTDATKLAIANNLSELTATASTARTNLGLGTAATISSTAGGDLSGTLPSPTVAKINGITLPASAPSAPGQVLTANSTTTTVWTTPSAGVQLDTTTADIQPLGTQAAGSTGKAADAGHVHTMPRLDQVNVPTASVALNSQKITGLANGTLATDAAAYGQIPVAGTTTGTYTAGNDARVVRGGSASRGATLLVASSTSSMADQAAADFLCTGSGDETVINTAIRSLPSYQGRVHLAAGTYYKSGPILIDHDSVVLSGEGDATYLTEASTAPIGGIWIGYQPITASTILSTTASTLAVSDTTQLPATGTVYAYASQGGTPIAVTYTGKTTTTLTGCTIVTGSLSVTANVSAIGTGLRQRCAIRDMKIDGVYTSKTGTGIGLWASATLFDGQRFEVRSYLGDGIYFQPYDGGVNGNAFEIYCHNVYSRANAGHQIHYGANCNNSEFIRCLPIGAGTRSPSSAHRGVAGFYVEGGGVKFIACHAYYNGTHGMDIRPTASAVTVVDGEYETSDAAGISVTGATRVKVVNARMYSNTTGDIIVQNSAYSCQFINTEHYLPASTMGKVILITASTKIRVISPSFNMSGGSSIVRLVSVENGSANCEIASLSATSLPVQDGNRYDVGLSSSGSCDVHDNNLVHGVIESGTADRNLIHHNVGDGTDTLFQIIKIGTNTQIERNIGFKDKSTGEALVASGTTPSTLVAHGLAGNIGGVVSRVMLSSHGDLSGGSRMYWSLPTTALSNGGSALALPATTVPVTSTTGFPTSGKLNVGGQIVAYTGVTSTSFTGCTGGTGSIADGAAVTSASHFAVVLAGTTTGSVYIDWRAQLYDE